MNSFNKQNQHYCSSDKVLQVPSTQQTSARSLLQCRAVCLQQSDVSTININLSVCTAECATQRIISYVINNNYWHSCTNINFVWKYNNKKFFFLAGSDTDLKYVSTLSDTPPPSTITWVLDSTHDLIEGFCQI